MAGLEAKNAGHDECAFVYWNEYLDMAELIEEGEASAQLNEDFALSDIPRDLPLSSANLEVWK